MGIKIIKAKNEEHYRLIRAMLKDMNTFLLSLGDRKPIKIGRDNRSYLVMDGGTVVGTFALTKEMYEYKTVYRLFIKEKYRNKGIGKYLLRHIWNEMLGVNCGITLDCYKHNTKAMKMYEDLGFKEYARQGDFIWYYVG